MGERIVSYAESYDYCVIANQAGLFPPNGYDYFRDLKQCPYCLSSLTFKRFDDEFLTHDGFERRQTRGYVERRYYRLSLGLCANAKCGWWALEQVEDNPEWFRSEVEIKWGQIKFFDVASREVPIKLLRSEIIRRPNLIHSTHHDSFERLMADCWRDKFPGSLVKHVGKSKDRGIDIYCIIDEEPCLVQVKRRTDGRIPEGPQAIRELNGVLLREGVYKGIFISTAKRFTEAAVGELTIKMETKKPVVIELISFDGIIDMVSKETENYAPWENYIVRG